MDILRDAGAVDDDDGPEWMDIGHVSQLPRGSKAVIDIYGQSVLVVHSLQGVFFALSNRCYHMGGPLDQGIVLESGSRPGPADAGLPEPCVECPWHKYIVGGITGHSYLATPDAGWKDKGKRQAVFQVRVVKNRIMVCKEETVAQGERPGNFQW
eukprot:ANDGO_02907.mRNA.1 Rieske domain containing